MAKKTTRRVASERRERSLRPREADTLRRLTEVEVLAARNRYDLDLQFRRIAEMQADLDKLKKG
jgi:hypothetical protein